MPVILAVMSDNYLYDNTVEILNPKIFVTKPNHSLVFIDTYMWKYLLDQKYDVLALLKEGSTNNNLKIVLNDYIVIELKQRKIYDRLLSWFKSSLIVIPVGYISANQIIHSLLCFVLNKKKIDLDWNIITSEVPVIKDKKVHLQDYFLYITKILNFLRNKYKWSNKEWIAKIVSLERKCWNDILERYGELLNLYRIPNFNLGHYKQFFYTDYFTNLPCIIFKSYFLGYILHERDLKIQDLVDVFTIFELLPYCDLYVMDKDQHNRFIKLQKDYKEIFNYFDFRTRIISKLNKSDLDLEIELKDFIVNLNTNKKAKRCQTNKE